MSRAESAAAAALFSGDNLFLAADITSMVGDASSVKSETWAAGNSG